jgi:hypothetical protein
LGTTSTKVKILYEVDAASTAVSGVDYKKLSGSATFAAGSLTATIPVVALTLPPENRSVIIRLKDDATGKYYALAAPNDPQTVLVLDGTNQAPQITSGPTGPGSVVADDSAALSIVATDPDSQPLPLTFTWSKVSGPGTVTFGPAGASTTAVFDTAGVYSVQVSVSDGATSVIRTLSVTVTAP